MNSLPKIALLAALAAAAVPISTTVPAAGPKSALEMTRTLIEDSSAARRIAQSGHAGAMAGREKARDLLEQAARAEAEGRREEAAGLLHRARKFMFEAVRMAGPDASATARRQNDYEDRLQSLKALLEARDRVSQEVGVKAGVDELHRMIEEKIDAAAVLQQQGELAEARAVLDEAYVAAKVAIEQLRGGETLVRSLNFASKEEEYHYEVDRNDTHKMLVTVLLKEKIEGDKRIGANVKQFMDKAAKVRVEAEKHAAKGDFEAAVEALELSTREIVRAIRSAGIYIPG